MSSHPVLTIRYLVFWSRVCLLSHFKIKFKMKCGRWICPNSFLSETDSKMFYNSPVIFEDSGKNLFRSRVIKLCITWVNRPTGI